MNVEPITPIDLKQHEAAITDFMNTEVDVICSSFVKLVGKSMNVMKAIAQKNDDGTYEVITSSSRNDNSGMFTITNLEPLPWTKTLTPLETLYVLIDCEKQIHAYEDPADPEMHKLWSDEPKPHFATIIDMLGILKWPQDMNEFDFGKYVADRVQVPDDLTDELRRKYAPASPAPALQPKPPGILKGIRALLGLQQ